VTGGVDRAARLRSDDEEWRLRDERDLLRRSLDDAALEHLAGDLTDEDFELLRSRDERRLAEVDAALDARVAASQSSEAPTVADVLADVLAEAPAASEAAGGPAGQSRGTSWFWRRGRWRRRWWLAALGVVSVLAATVLLVVDLTSPRLPGQYATGSISLNTAQTIERQLDQAKVLVAAGKVTQAMELYGDVLAEDPRQPVALAEWGWLDWRAASAARQQTVAAEGASALEEAVKVDRHLFVAQYYLGVVLYDEGAAAKAVSHFAAFLVDKPTAKWLGEAAPEIRAAYGAAHETVPVGVPET
jgi:tetratricopeptide (TPR) repeat protein